MVILSQKQLQKIKGERSPGGRLTIAQTGELFLGMLSLGMLSQDVFSRPPFFRHSSSGVRPERKLRANAGADLSNSLNMTTDYVPGAWMAHDQLHVRGGHHVSWAIDGAARQIAGQARLSRSWNTWPWNTWSLYLLHGL